MRAVRPATLCTTALTAIVALLVPAAPARADSIRDDQWWLKSLKVAAVHQVTQGEGIVVAVVDTGVDADHPDLKGNVLPGADLFDESSRGQEDPHGHGTSMASLIAGHGHGAGNRSGILGVAPKAKILPVRVMRETGVNPPSNVTMGINWAIDNGADVINVSIATGYDAALSAAIERAYKRNIPVIAGVGNRGTQILAGYPASHPGAIGVTIVGKGDKSTPENLTDENIKMAAPGADIVAAEPGNRYSTTSGSSNSSAITAGAMALVRAEHPDLNGHDLFERMLWTTRDIGDKGKDWDFGWGTLDLERAVTGKPDDRGASAPATTDVSPPLANPAWEGCQGCPSTTERVLQIVALFGGLLLVIGLVVFFLVRRKRKKRHTEQQLAPTTAGPYTQTPTTPPQQHSPTGDDNAWRRPPGS